jgi:molybdenum ABC transporter ATP-binding protein
LTLEICNVSKRLGLFSLGPLNINIDKEILVIIGPTGSGKTSLLNIIAGILKPDKGNIWLEGKNITKQPTESRKIGYVFQHPSLFPHLTTYNNIVFGLGRRKQDTENVSTVKKVIDDLGIGDLLDRKIDYLSGGEMQKVSLARMLVMQPKIILLDEPLANLDFPTRDKLRIELRNILRKLKIPVIHVSHFEEDVYALADSIAVMDKGKIETSGNIEQILKFQNTISSEFLNKVTALGNYLIGLVINSEDDLTSFKIGSTVLYTVGKFIPKSRIGVIVKKEDIILARDKVKTSARNMIYARVENIIRISNNVDVHLKSDELTLISRITRRAADELNLTAGDHIYVIFKASSPHLIREEN